MVWQGWGAVMNSQDWEESLFFHGWDLSLSGKDWVLSRGATFLGALNGPISILWL